MGHIQIHNYEPRFRDTFRELNEWWIHQYFEMEKKDYQILHDPETHILNKGGYILVALYDSLPAGVCALLPSDRNGIDFELSKMGVAPHYHGLGIGMALGKAVLKKARGIGAKRVFLESNTILGPAISLYRKLGFREIPSGDSPYQRCNIQMEINL